MVERQRATRGRDSPGREPATCRTRNALGAGRAARPEAMRVRSAERYQLPEAGQAPLPAGAQVRVIPPPAARVIVNTPAVSDLDFAVIV